MTVHAHAHACMQCKAFCGGAFRLPKMSRHVKIMCKHAGKGDGAVIPVHEWAGHCGCRQHGGEHGCCGAACAALQLPHLSPEVRALLHMTAYSASMRVVRPSHVWVVIREGTQREVVGCTHMTVFLGVLCRGANSYGYQQGFGGSPGKAGRGSGHAAGPSGRGGMPSRGRGGGTGPDAGRGRGRRCAAPALSSHP